MRFNAGPNETFAALIDRAKAERVVDDDTHEILHLGRKFRNGQIHATTMAAGQEIADAA